MGIPGWRVCQSQIYPAELLEMCFIHWNHKTKGPSWPALDLAGFVDTSRDPELPQSNVAIEQDAPCFPGQ